MQFYSVFVVNFITILFCFYHILQTYLKLVKAPVDSRKPLAASKWHLHTRGGERSLFKSCLSMKTVLSCAFPKSHLTLN